MRGSSIAKLLIVILVYATCIMASNVLIVEADGVFEGHQRVRVLKSATLETIIAAIGTVLPSTTADISPLIFDAVANAFVPLHSADQVKSHARILIPRQSSVAVAAIASRGFNYDFEAGEMTIHGEPLFIGEVGNTGQGTGLTIWDGSVVLAKYLEGQQAGDAHNVAGLRVLELGAGTGLVGLAAAFCGASSVLLTDLAYTLPNTESNIARNEARLRAKFPDQNVDAAELDWFAPGDMPDVDIILGSDIVWVETLIPALVTTIERLLRPPPMTPATSGATRFMLLSHQTRSTASDNLLFALLANANLRVQPVDVSRVRFPDDDMQRKLRLYEIRP
ncbi:hypothetical protein ACHHYP_08348 [Achlya hypogyna]|uniref:Secreted protein n=1 Tax=Achlya hypogyna TaxID=1202772 RepID=A0A1V9ZKV6_ACHHY|nr:hypothetical protein ACHHYP_08348 [Achlya hypogyna]